MKTREFIEIMKNNGYMVTRTNGSIYVGYDGHTIVEVPEYTFGAIDTSWSGFEKLEQHEVEHIIGTAYKYIMTPLEEREEPKKYYLRLPDNFEVEYGYYLNHYVDYNGWGFHSKDEEEGIKTQFTRDEIDSIPIKGLIEEEVKLN